MPKLKVETVTGKLDTVTKIQIEFLQHPEFVYFRKGEFANVLNVAYAHLDAIMTGIGVKITADITATTLKTKLTNWRRQPHNSHMANLRDLRFIMCETTEESDSFFGADALCEAGFKKGLIQPEQAGRLRYFVSSKGYFLFFRNRDGSFYGLQGEDVETRDCLRGLFLDEWQQILRPNNKS